MTEEGSPFRFECQRSGNCCARPEGFVRVDLGEVRRIAEHLGLSEEGFRGRYLDGERLKQGVGVGCVFLGGERGRAECTIYAVRPQRCRSWPFWIEVVGSRAGVEEAKRVCPGIWEEEEGEVGGQRPET